MIGADFSYEQGVVTVNSMNDSKRAAMQAAIDREFTRFYDDNYPRFASMYGGRATVFGNVLSYADMLDPKILSEISVVH